MIQIPENTEIGVGRTQAQEFVQGDGFGSILASGDGAAVRFVRLHGLSDAKIWKK